METVKINGKQYPVKFGLGQFKRFADKKGIKNIEDFDKWLSKLNDGSFDGLEGAADLLLMGLQRGCQKQKIECDLDVEDVMDLTLDEPKALNDLMEILKTSMSTGDTIVKSEKTEIKKK